MHSSTPQLEVTATVSEASPSMPLCVRSKSLHPLDVQSTSQAVVQRPSQKRIWTQQSITQPYATPSFPLDPALCGQAVTVVSGGSQNGLRVITSPMPYPTPVSHLAFIPPQFQNGGAIHLLSQQYIQGIDPRVDPRMLQRTHSNYGPATSSHPSDPHIVYDCQVTAADQRGQAIAWTTREVVLRSPPLPRQRSAKACKKCRKRKTKCSGGQPCTRCTARGLECEYDEKSTLRGPSKARLESRKKSSAKAMSIDTTASLPNSPIGHRDEKLPATSPSYSEKVPSVMQPAPAGRDNNRTQPPQPYSFQTASVAPDLDGSVQLGFNPSYAQYMVAEPLSDTSTPEGAHVSASVDAPDPSSLIQGYVVPGNQESVIVPITISNNSWQGAARPFDRDPCDYSRSPSACSDYSHSSSDASIYSQASSSDLSFASSYSSDHVAMWPAAVPDYSFGRSIPPALSTSSSSSSLRDALLEKPRTRASSHSASAFPESATTSSAAASALTSVLSQARLSDPEHVSSASSETSSILQGMTPPSPNIPSAPSVILESPSHQRSALSWQDSQPVMAPSSAALRFEDVFNLPPEPPTTLSPSAPFETMLSRENTIKARPSRQSLAQRAVGADVLANHNASPSLDTETPHIIEFLHFGGQFTAPVYG